MRLGYCCKCGVPDCFGCEPANTVPVSWDVSMPSAIVYTMGGGTTQPDFGFTTIDGPDGSGFETHTTITTMYPNLSLISSTSLNLPKSTQATAQFCPCTWAITDVYWIYKCGEEYSIAYPGDLGATTAVNTVSGTEYSSYVDSTSCFKTFLAGHPDPTCGGSGAEFAGSDDWGVSAGFNGTTGTGKWRLSFGVRHNQETLSETYQYASKIRTTAYPLGVGGLLIRYEKTFSCADLTGSPIALTITSASAAAATAFGITAPSTATVTPVY